MNDGYAYHERLGLAAEGRTLLQYLSQRFDHSSSVEWAERIASGQVLIGGLPSHADSVLRAGDEWYGIVLPGSSRMRRSHLTCSMKMMICSP